MKKKTPNPAAQALGRIGGKIRSERKSAAARERNRKYWEEVRAGIRPPPQKGKRNRREHSKAS